MGRLAQIAISVALVSLVHWTSGRAQTLPQDRTQSQPQTQTPTQVPGQSQAPAPTQTPVPAPIQAQIPTSGGTQQPDTVPTSELKSAPPTPIAEKKAELGDDHTWNPEWDKIIEQGLAPDLLSSKVAKAVKQFCPHFNAMGEPDKRAFWAYFFQALAGAETSLVSTTNVRHDDSEMAVVDDVTHRKVRQQGLLQLTYMDQERYGCDFNWEKDGKLEEHDPDKTILQPKNNLLCGVAILKNQLIDQHKPLLSRTSYWSSLRPGTRSVKVFLKQMANVPAACGQRPVRGQQQHVVPIRETVVARHHHVRIWRTGREVDGVPLRAGAATEDISIEIAMYKCACSTESTQTWTRSVISSPATWESHGNRLKPSTHRALTRC